MALLPGLLRASPAASGHRAGRSLKVGEEAVPISIFDTEAITTGRRQGGVLDHGLLESVEHEFFNSSPDGVLFIGRGGRVLAANRTQARLHGYDSPDDLIGVHASELVVPSDRDRARLNIERRLRGEDIGSTEYEGLRRDGTTFYVEISAAALRDLDDEVSGYVCIIRDRTEQKLVEMSLRESEERHRALFDGAIEGIYQASLDGGHLRANEAWAQMLGYNSAAQAMTEVVDVSQVWADPGEQARFVGLLREKGDVRGYECEFVRKDASRIWVSINGRLVSSPGGGQEHYQGFVEDITEHRHAQAVLREKDSQFRNYVENAPVAIIVARDGVCLYGNQALADMIGAESSEALVGGRIYEGFAPHTQEDSKERTRRRSLGLATPSEFESVLRRADGSLFPAHISLGTVRLQDGSAIIGFITDITERRRAEEALSQSETMRDVAERVARVGSWRWHFDPTAFFWSEELFELFDVDPDTFDGDVMSGLQSRIHADDVEAFMTVRDAAFNTGQAPPIEFRVVHRDASVHFIHGASTTERDDTGKAVAIVGYFQDVTDRHEAAARLMDAAFEWRATFDAMSDSVSLFDRDGRIVRCNAATVRLTGRDFRDIVGHFCHEVFHDPDYAGCPRRRAFLTGQAETDIVERDGVWLRITFTPEKEATGRVVGGVHVVTDITQLRQAEQVASERSHFLEELLEAIPAPVHNTDVTFHYVACNEAY
ncbi:MAG: PAS domain-containing protein, partial [Acidimicrobiales bacterium]